MSFMHGVGSLRMTSMTTVRRWDNSMNFESSGGGKVDGSFRMMSYNRRDKFAQNYDGSSVWISHDEYSFAWVL